MWTGIIARGGAGFVSRRARLVLGWTAALLAAALFARLGLWQSGRAVEKERMLADAAAVLEARRPATLQFRSSALRVPGSPLRLPDTVR